MAPLQEGDGSIPAMLPLDSCFMTSGFRVSLGPVDTGLDAAGILASSLIGDCLLATKRDAERPRLMGTILRRNADRARRSVAISLTRGTDLGANVEKKFLCKTVFSVCSWSTCAAQIDDVGFR